MPPFFRYLNPPMISEMHKNNMCAYFLHNLLLSSFAKLIQTVMFNRYHDYRPKTYFTNITSQITMPWNRPCCSINLKFSGNMPRFVLGKVRKFQDPSSSRLGDIQEKPEGWIKTTPPATNRVNPRPACPSPTRALGGGGDVTVPVPPIWGINRRTEKIARCYIDNPG